MPRVRPFRGVRPDPALARAVIAPPYDVLSRDEARAIASAEPRSFLHVTRPDADLPDDVDVHSERAYATARANLDRLLAEGALVQDAEPCFYLYAQTWRGRTQVGLLGLAEVADYDAGVIKKHELTRPDKEQDRVDHILATGAQTGLVFLAWRDRHARLREAIAAAMQAEPEWTAETDDGVIHAFRVVRDADRVRAIEEAMAEVPALYVADGHHRSAAASRVARELGGAHGSDGFLAGIFPDSQLQVLAYNRVVRGLNGRDSEAFLAELAEHFVLTPDVEPIPAGRGRVTMYLDGRWTELAARPGVVPDDPVGSLDVSVLQDRVLGPILGIANPRTDARISFVGGIRGPEALVAAVDAERAAGRQAVAFHLHPTGLDQLFAVADADRLMPPKSTWFEPKLRGGVVVHLLRDAPAGTRVV